MVDVEKLEDKMYHRRISKKKMAQELNITPKTFYLRLKTRRFYSDEMDTMVDVLRLSRDEAIAIFFTPKVTET